MLGQVRRNGFRIVLVSFLAGLVLVVSYLVGSSLLAEHFEARCRALMGSPDSKIAAEFGEPAQRWSAGFRGCGGQCPLWDGPVWAYNSVTDVRYYLYFDAERNLQQCHWAGS